MIYVKLTWNLVSVKILPSMNEQLAMPTTLIRPLCAPLFAGRPQERVRFRIEQD